MKRKVGDFSEFVEHPRYGRSPRLTDTRPREKPHGYRLTTYISNDTIGGTAVEADLDRQTSSPVPVLYYFDLKRVCVDCQRPFIFFAEEQKYWCESFGFVFDADCIRCVECRRLQQGLDRRRQRYEELFHREERSAEENLEMAPRLNCDSATHDCRAISLRDSAEPSHNARSVSTIPNRLIRSSVGFGFAFFAIAAAPIE